MVIGTEQKTHPSPRAFAHAVLRTNTDQYKKMVDFYKRLLNAKIVHDSPVLTFLRYDDEHHRIAIMQSPKHYPKSTNKIHAEVDHLAFTYHTLTDLARLYVSMKSGPEPREPIWAVNHGPSTSIYYRDPDGNKIECQVDNFDTAEEADAFMKSPLFAQNPIGTEIDAEKWSELILSYAKSDGKEGLSPENIKKLKTRVEIGERFALPEGLA